MSFDACETLVKAGDHDRWLSARTAPPGGRKALMAIYAANLMIARAPWASPEPLVAQMRLRWWGDEIGRIYEGDMVTSHEILPALSEVIRACKLPRQRFDTLVEARMQDVIAAPYASREAFDSYINATSGNVMVLAAMALGAPEQSIPVVADFAYGAGLAGLLRAVPELRARGKQPWVEPLGAHVQKAIVLMAGARARRGYVPGRAHAAMLAGWRADATLSHALKHPEHIISGQLEESPARRMVGFHWRRLTGRW